MAFCAASASIMLKGEGTDGQSDGSAGAAYKWGPSRDGVDFLELAENVTFQGRKLARALNA